MLLEWLPWLTIALVALVVLWSVRRMANSNGNGGYEKSLAEQQYLQLENAKLASQLEQTQTQLANLQELQENLQPCHRV